MLPVAQTTFCRSARKDSTSQSPKQTRMTLSIERIPPSNCFRLHPTSMISEHSTVPVPDRPQAPRKISFAFRFWHKSFFILDDVNLAQLSDVAKLLKYKCRVAQPHMRSMALHPPPPILVVTVTLILNQVAHRYWSNIGAIFSQY